MREIKLTKGQVAIVDDWNFEWLSQYKWFAQWSEDTQSYYAACKSGKKIYMHRLISKTPKGMICDHKNHNTLFNLESNLRNVTPSESNMNRKKYKSRLGERCISPHYGSFDVRVQKNGKYVFRKTYKTLAEAIIARDNAIKMFYGNYSYSLSE